MVPLGRELVSSHRLSIQTLVSGTVWPQFAMHVLTESCQPQFGGRGGYMGSKMGPLSSPGTTFYELPRSCETSIIDSNSNRLCLLLARRKLSQTTQTINGA